MSDRCLHGLLRRRVWSAACFDRCWPTFGLFTGRKTKGGLCDLSAGNDLQFPRLAVIANRFAGILSCRDLAALRLHYVSGERVLVDAGHVWRDGTHRIPDPMDLVGGLSEV